MAFWQSGGRKKSEKTDFAGGRSSADDGENQSSRQKPSLEDLPLEDAGQPGVEEGLTSIEGAVITVKTADYTGKARKPAVTVKRQGEKLKKGRDYSVSYRNNVQPGYGEVTISGTGSYTGTAGRF